jgi:hypothetical protein
MSDMPLPSSLKERVLKGVLAKPAPTRRTEALRAALLIAGSIAIALAIFFARGGLRLTGRPAALVLGTSLGTAVIAAVGAWFALGRRSSMLGRSSLALSVAAVVTPIALLFWKIVWSAQFPGGTDPWPERVGFRCLKLTLLMGVPPLLAILFARRRTDPTHPRIAGLGAGASVGLCVALFVDMWCPVAYLPHLLLGHILPIALLGMLGFLVGTLLLAPKR